MALPTIAVTPGSGATLNTLQNAGQNTMANSHPIVVASDQTAIPTSAASLPLPAGAATSALQNTTNTSLAQLHTDLAGTLSTRATSGLGAMAAVPAGSTNGTALGALPANATGARLYLPTGSSMSFTVASAQPSSAPTSVFAVSQAGTGPNWDENLNGQMIYVTALTGSPLFRWY